MIKANVGDIIRAYDFKPMVGREDCFVEGVIEQNNCTEPGYNCFKITVTKDSWDNHRVGQIVFVPHRVSFMEYAGRVINLSEI